MLAAVILHQWSVLNAVIVHEFPGPRDFLRVALRVLYYTGQRGAGCWTADNKTTTTV